MVRVHYGEGVATHTGPESCTGGREAVGEALTGEHAGQVLSGVSKFPGADAVTVAEGNMARCDIASVVPTRRRQRPWNVCTSSAREPGDPCRRPGDPTSGPHRKDFGRSR
jgi:RNA-directed DNA polymerase